MISFRKADLIDKVKGNLPSRYVVKITYDASLDRIHDFELDGVSSEDENGSDEKAEMISNVVDRYVVGIHPRGRTVRSLYEATDLIKQVVSLLRADDRFIRVSDFREEEDTEHDASEYNKFHYYITVIV